MNMPCNFMLCYKTNTLICNKHIDIFSHAYKINRAVVMRCRYTRRNSQITNYDI